MSLLSLNLVALRALLVLGTPALGVRGEFACPAPEMVASLLRPLLPEEAVLPPGAWIDLAVAAGTGTGTGTGADGPSEFVLKLVRANGATPVPIGRLRVSASCEAAAEEAAVLIAAWVANYETPTSADLDALPTAVGSAGSLAADSEPLDAANLAPQKGPTIPSLVESKPRIAPDPRAPESRQPVRWFGRLGLSAALTQGTAGTTAGLGSVEGMVLGSWSHPGWMVARLSVSLSGVRTLPIGPGTSNWQRLGGVLAVGWRRYLGTTAATGADVPVLPGSSSFYVELTGGPMVADSMLVGSGYASDFRSSGIDVGLAPAARLGWQAGRRITAWSSVEGWIELGCIAWVRPHEVVVINPTMSRRLPWLDAVLSLGVSFGAGR